MDGLIRERLRSRNLGYSVSSRSAHSREIILPYGYAERAREVVP